MRFLFVDRIVELIEGKVVRGIKHITADEAFLTQDHTSSPPHFIPSLIGETLGQLAAWNVMLTQDFKARPVAGIVHEATLLRPTFVGETLSLTSFIDRLDEKAVEYHSIAHINNEPVFTLEGALGPLLPMQDFIDDITVRQQLNAIYQNPSLRGEAEAIQRPLKPLDCFGFASQKRSTHFSFDRIIKLDPTLRILAEKKIVPTAPYFPDHFPNQPVLPLTVLLECIRRLATTFIETSDFSKSYQLHSFKKIKMKSFVHPGDIITSELTLKDQTEDTLVLLSQTARERTRICTLELIFKIGRKP